MPKLKECQLPKYRLHKQSGQAIVTLGGRDCLLGKYGTAASKQEYRRLTAEWLAGHAPAKHAPSVDGLTIAELVLAFWRHAQTYYRGSDGRPTTEVSNLKPVLKLLRQNYGRTRAAAELPNLPQKKAAKYVSFLCSA